MRLKLIASLIFVLSCYPAQAQTVRVTSPSQHPYRHMPNELNTIDTAADEECYTYEGDTAQGEWQTCGGGSGDPILIDGTGVTDASGVDLIGGTTGIDITFSAAASPDTATFGLDLTEITCGAGLACASATAIATASSEADFLASGALTCGASTAGKIQVHTTPLQYCDNAATPTLQYAAYGDSSGNATGVACTGCVEATDISNGVVDGTELASNTKIVSFGITIDGGGSAITTGVKGYVEIPFAMTITQATMLADQSGSAVCDLWVDSYANFPPTDADSITASAPPTITSATKSQDSTLTGWTTSITAGQIVGFNIDSASTIQRLHIIVRGNKS